MADTLEFGGKTFTSSKRAAESSGYTQDYIGQLARKGLIVAERVGNLWYVSMDSLVAYKQHADTYVPQQPQVHGRERDSYISFDGKDYISASRGAKITGYNPDYIGQLARAGKVLSRQVGSRWYVERESLMAHKRAKDALLAAVQSEAVGLPRAAAPAEALEGGEAREISDEPHFRYFRDDRQLLPITRSVVATPVAAHTIDLRILRSAPKLLRTHATTHEEPHTGDIVRATGKSKFGATAALALTIVLMLSVGLVSIKDEAVFTLDWDAHTRMNIVRHSAAVERASASIERIAETLEAWIVPELHYQRAQ
jgi:hypothetical protein